MVTLSLLTLIHGDLKVSVPFLILLCIPTEAAVVLRHRKMLRNRPETHHLIPFIFLGLIAGTFLLKEIPNPDLIRSLGILIMVVAFYYLIFENRIKAALSTFIWKPIMGILSGTLGGTYGISGPPLIIFFKARKLDKGQFRTVLLSLFLFMSACRLIFYLIFNLFTLRILISSIICLPFVGLGLYTGARFHHIIPESLFKTITSIVLFISGLLLFL
jgi:uncharacterized membrane protein YfcA